MLIHPLFWLLLPMSHVEGVPSTPEAFTFERDGYACLCIRIDEADETHPPPPYADELADDNPCPPSD